LSATRVKVPLRVRGTRRVACLLPVVPVRGAVSRRGYDWGREPAALDNLSVLTMVQPSLDREQQRKRGMSVLVFVLLTVAIFAVLGLIQKVVERL